MGHSSKSNDMGALYTQRISDERLQKVVAHVRAWLWPENSLDWDDPNHEKAAVRIAAEWNTKDRLSHIDIAAAIKQLCITQRELARGTGLSEDWISLIIIGKETMSADTELKIRYYVEDVSEGKIPQRKMKDQLWPQFKKPKDIPLTDSIEAGLAAHPLTPQALTELVNWLASMGITQIKLAEWWRLNYGNVREMRAGRRTISTRSANRLRELFGIAPGQTGGAL
jgi:plasmid maintenance system antidote protein VapI